MASRRRRRVSAPLATGSLRGFDGGIGEMRDVIHRLLVVTAPAAAGARFHDRLASPDPGVPRPGASG